MSEIRSKSVSPIRPADWTGWAVSLLVTACVATACTAGSDVTVDDPWEGRWPMLHLANDRLALLMGDPRGDDAFNRASRFDRAGMVVLATTADGHRLFGPLQEPAQHEPTRDDHVAGTAGEFGPKSPLGFEEAGPGDGFVKIGVGVLQRPDERVYFFRRSYEVLDPGTWQLKREADAVTFTHELTGPRGWAYRYETQIKLLADKPGFKIRRTLTNTGDRLIETDYYTHNFVVLDGQRITPEHEVVLSRRHAVASGHAAPAWCEFDGMLLRIPRMPDDDGLYLPLEPPDAADEAWSAVFRSADAGAALSLETDPSPDRVVIYAKQPYLSVEPFHDIVPKAGESQTWTAVYRVE